MSTRERLRRDPPHRTGPRRSFLEFWAPNGSQGGPSSNGGGEREDEGNPVARAVRMAYEVADEQIELGQRVARQINDQAYDFSGASDDVQEMTKRFWRFGQDFVALWFDAASRFPGAAASPPSNGAEQTAAANGEGSAGSANGRQRGSGRAHGHRRQAANQQVLVEIASRQKARVSVNLWGDCDGELLETHGARALDSALPPIDTIVYTPASAEEPAVLSVTVADDQPPGDYTGVLVMNGHDVVGSLVVRITE